MDIWCVDRQTDWCVCSTAAFDQSPTFVDLVVVSNYHTTSGDRFNFSVWKTAGGSEEEKENIAIHLTAAHPQPWTPLLSTASSAPVSPCPSPPNRAESVKNLTNGFICCQISADLSFPWTILLDTLHSWVSLLAFWLELTVPCSVALAESSSRGEQELQQSVWQTLGQCIPLDSGSLLSIFSFC